MAVAFAPAVRLAPLRDFVVNLAGLLTTNPVEPELLLSAGRLLTRLVSRDDWLSEAFAAPNPERYQQYLLHCDSEERFSVVAFVWAPGQRTPIHDHRVWGLVGVLRGAERVERFGWAKNGSLVPTGPATNLYEGEVEAVSPSVGDIHRVSNGSETSPSVSIHVYGANIGAVERATYDADGHPRRFISGYANSVLPNLWDRSGQS